MTFPLGQTDALYTLFDRYRTLADRHRTSLARFVDNDGDVEEGRGRAYTRQKRTQALEAQQFLEELMAQLDREFTLPDDMQVTLPGSDGDRFTVTTGVLDEAAVKAFRFGQCHALAHVLCETPGWQAAVLLSEFCAYDPDLCTVDSVIGDVCGCRLAHVVAVRPDGAHVDVTGAHLPGTVPDYEGCESIPLTPQVWDHLCRSPFWLWPALDVARTFVAPLLTSLACPLASAAA